MLLFVAVARKLYCLLLVLVLWSLLLFVLLSLFVIGVWLLPMRALAFVAGVVAVSCGCWLWRCCWWLLLVTYAVRCLLCLVDVGCCCVVVAVNDTIECSCLWLLVGDGVAVDWYVIVVVCWCCFSFLLLLLLYDVVAAVWCCELRLLVVVACCCCLLICVVGVCCLLLLTMLLFVAVCC